MPKIRSKSFNGLLKFWVYTIYYIIKYLLHFRKSRFSNMEENTNSGQKDLAVRCDQFELNEEKLLLWTAARSLTVAAESMRNTRPQTTAQRSVGFFFLS